MASPISARERPGAENPKAALTTDLLVNTLPVAGDDTIVRSGTNDVKTSIASLLSNDSDADGDIIAFVEVSASGTNNAPSTCTPGLRCNMRFRRCARLLGMEARQKPWRALDSNFTKLR